MGPALDTSDERDSERMKSALAASGKRLEDELALLLEIVLRKLARRKRSEDGVLGRRSSNEAGVEFEPCGLAPQISVGVCLRQKEGFKNDGRSVRELLNGRDKPNLVGEGHDRRYEGTGSVSAPGVCWVTDRSKAGRTGVDAPDTVLAGALANKTGAESDRLSLTDCLGGLWLVPKTLLRSSASLGPSEL